MLFVKTKVLPSKIQGLGLFADKFIPKGTIIWKFTPGFDLKFTQAQIKKFPKQVQSFLNIYGWKSKKSGTYCLAADNARYFNHSKNPNCLSAYYGDEEEDVIKAIRAIQKGEEITENYSTFSKGFKEEDLE